ncbi:MAG: bifunctional UDP-3-O-[3-hydroxymyristoyl] N-acetylglucosamine deacetylase/3-hydroxyacyl-ACP dehydratase [Candidatus Krumholzibacteria bacterium]|nr:bifunctional UDP-3-O-[3-hydroxymyristoyl] N-acetylglucosamine deacetylase/3-hydroxyacyl-ACP dehydratase [Candidatus Krumholzibacteria bacterium]
MLWLQKTIASEVTVEGIGLHSGAKARMTFAPAPINTGLVFVVPGADGDIEIPALVENVTAERDLVRATTLAKDGVTIHTVEHVLAALAGMGISNCYIQLQGGEPPVVACASSLRYVEMIEEAGILDQGVPGLTYKINRPVTLRQGDVEISAEPADKFLISFTVDYDDPGIGIQAATFEIRPWIFRDEIASARTFALMSDVTKLQEMGLVKGGSFENALVFDNGELVGDLELRFPDECVRHKILDLIGDLALLGMPIQGHVKARLAGHASNVEFTRLLAKTERKMPRVYPPRNPEHWDVSSIMKIMPHRYPFLLVDRITNIEPGKRVTGLKNVTINEPFFAGHFPNHPIMPAVLIIEAMAQVGGVLILSNVDDPRGKLVYFSGIDKARFRQPVTPGDQLRFELEMIKLRGPICKMRGTARVDGKIVAEAELMSTVVDS